MGQCWTLALEQRTDLTPSHGSVSKLAAAVRRGADLRLYMTTGSVRGNPLFPADLCRRG